MMRPFSAVNEGDLKDVCDSDRNMVPVHDAADEMVEILKDEELHVECSVTLSVT